MRPRPQHRPHRFRAELVVFGLLVGACTREPQGRFVDQAEPEPATERPSTPFGFAPTIAKAAQTGETVVLLLEIVTTSDRRMDAVVGVHRGAAPDLAIEVWTFDQANKDDVLLRVGEPASVLRTRTDGAGAVALQPLRLRMAAAGASIHRRLGAVGETPSAVVESLATAAKTVRDPSATPRARVDALAHVFAGLDDGMIFEQDAVGVAIDQLAADAWRVETSTAVSDRRVTARTTSGTTIEMLRKGDGWVIATTRR